MLENKQRTHSVHRTAHVTRFLHRSTRGETHRAR